MSSTFGRRTWNKEDYIPDGESSKRYDDNHLADLSEGQLQLLKKKYTDYNQLMKDSIKGLNQRTMFANVSQYKKGKQFGFYCDICNLTFKDTLQFIDHLNSKPHQIKFETIFHEDLIFNKRDNDDVPLEEFRTSYLDEIRQFVKINDTTVKTSKSQSNRLSKMKKVQKDPNLQPVESEMNKMMGFASFGSSKK